MSYTVLARRYRSQTFDDVIGQESVARTLKNAIMTGRVAHAYLFTGTRGVGKTSMARILAKALNCLSSKEPTPTPCCKCELCLAANEGNDIDVIEIDGASNRGIDNIRELRDKALYRPARARFKIYIIDEVHMLTGEAFNALLKILEEPPSHIKFIFATTEPHKVLATIQSRCQRFDFVEIPPAKLAQHLRDVLKREKVDFEDDLVIGLTRLANGSMRDGLSLLDRLLSTGIRPLTASMLQEYLGQSSRESIHRLLAAVASSDAAQALASLDSLISGGQSAVGILEACIDYFRDLMVLKSAGSATELVILTESQRKVAIELVDSFDLPAIIYSISTLEKMTWSIKNSDNPRALLEAAILRLALNEHFLSIPDILAQLQRTGAAPQPVSIKKNLVTDSPAVGSSRLPGMPSPPSPVPADVPLTIEHIITAWPAILEHLESKGGGLAAKVISSSPSSFQNGLLTLSFNAADPASKMLAGICTQPHTKERLQTAFSEVLGTPVTLQVIVQEQSAAAPSPSSYKPRGAKTSQKELNEILNDSSIKTLILGLNARVTGVESSSDSTDVNPEE